MGYEGWASPTALDVLSGALAWKLPAHLWPEVDSAVRELGRTTATGNADEVESAIDRLLFLGPVRARKIDAEPPVEAPPEVREEINRLIHTVGVSPEPR